jgi:hypothetical protein
MEGDPSAEQARKKAESNARMTRLFTVLTLLVGIFTVGTVGYAIYRQPANPQPLDSATVEVVGDVHTTFSGTVGTLTDERTVSGASQLSLEVPYKQADYVVATIEQQGPGKLRVRIRAQQEIVDEGQANGTGDRVALMWQAPRAENNGPGD